MLMSKHINPVMYFDPSGKVAWMIIPVVILLFALTSCKSEEANVDDFSQHASMLNMGEEEIKEHLYKLGQQHSKTQDYTELITTIGNVFSDELDVVMNSFDLYTGNGISAPQDFISEGIYPFGSMVFNATFIELNYGSFIRGTIRDRINQSIASGNRDNYSIDYYLQYYLLGYYEGSRD